MYHDQGLIPLKLHAFDQGVNVTIPAAKAAKSKDLWRLIAQKQLMRLNPGPGSAEPPPAPPMTEADKLREDNPGSDITVNNGPCDSVEATVESGGWPPVEHIFGRPGGGMSAAEDMLAKLERALDASG